MEGIKGRIRVFGTKPSKALMRFMKRQLEKWVEREQTLLFLPKDFSYEIKIDREPEESFFSCQISIRVGSREWTAYDGGKSIQVAFIRAYHHIRSTNDLRFAIS